MPVTAVIGAQWGDEGKGKIVDLLAQRADVVARFGGGANAGHTIVNELGTFRLHSLPSGAFNPRTVNVIGTGTVVDFDSLAAELEQVEKAGASRPKLIISDRAHIVMPYHKTLDRLKETALGDMRVGTTGQGVGPCYVDKVDRTGIQAGELHDRRSLEEKIRFLLALKNQILWRIYGEPAIEIDGIMELLDSWAGRFGENIQDTTAVVSESVERDDNVVLEGQLGVMRDLDWGTYPYVTSSTTFAAGAGAGLGIPPCSITDVVGVVKAYTTAVGEGPLPTELHGAEAAALREAGHEYGATTGRPRRVGWLDGVALAYATRIGAMTRLAVTKLDVLDGMSEIKIGVAYRDADGLLSDYPHPSRLDQVQPVYETLPGWDESTAGARSWDDLPSNAHAYLHRMEQLTGLPVAWVGAGQHREETIEVGSTATLTRAV